VSLSTFPQTPVAACSRPPARAPLPAERAAVLSRSFKALADPTRLRLLSLIAAPDGGETCVCDLSAPLELSQPTISHHLRVLREAGLVTSDRRGTWVYYRLVPGALDELADLLSPAAPPSGPSCDERGR
jgi:ArsR family transcriptional regulator, arsenate/arsenite/antimonite-responsive transcriptional repressor